MLPLGGDGAAPVGKPWDRQHPDWPPHLHINVCSVLKQQFHEWLVPLQGSDVETGQTWDGVRVWAANLRPPTLSLPLFRDLPTPQPQGTHCPLNAYDHRTVKTQIQKSPQKSKGKGTQSFHHYRVMLLKLSCFRDQA